MVKTASWNLNRWSLLAGVSLLALGAELYAPSPAVACSSSSSGSATIQGPTGCFNWSGGDLTLTNGGVLTSSGTPALTANPPSGTLINSGHINGDLTISSGSGTVYGGLLVLGAGTITRMDNATGTIDTTGSISSGTANIIGAMVNQGSIGTLTNSGTFSINGTISTNYGVPEPINVVAAIANAGGTIASLTNSGTIIATGTMTEPGINRLDAIFNSGSIGTLQNDSNATITSSHFAIENTGNIGLLGNTGTISSSGSAAIGNFGSATIATLTNSGTISGNNTGIQNASQIGTLSNSGTISGGSYGVSNTSTIGSINNSSLISGGTDGILNNGGSIGILTNTGTIMDNFVAAIYNASGTIGTLNNTSGTISGAVGIANISGTIGTLTNGGVISGSSIGIYNLGGTIGTLTNSGTISGSSYAINIDSSGNFGPITNAGLIAGNIANASSNNLSINGGSGSTFGTLTGSSRGIGSADRGTITNTASNVVFSFGNLLLNDNIDATGHMVTNTGATLRLINPVAITGTYNQTGGGLLISAANGGASYGYLAVSGNATVTNSTITISGAGLSVGQSYTIVRSGGAGSYTNDTAVVAVTSGLTATITTVNQNLVVGLVAGNSGDTGGGGSDNSGGGDNSGSSSGGSGGGTTTIPPTTYAATGAATGGAAAPMGKVLDNIAAGTSPAALAFQATILPLINALPAAQQGAAIKQLAPTQNVPAAQMSSNAATAVLGAVEQHQQTAMAYDPATGAAAGSEAHDSALWGQVLGGGSRRDSNAQADGYSSSNFGLAAGMDHLFTPNAMGGVALSWVRAWSDGLDNSRGSSSILDSYQLTFYGTYRLDQAFVDGQLGAGWNQFSQKRGIAFAGRTAAADYDGQQYLAKATFGYDVPLGPVTVTPLAGLRWLRAVSDSYEENGAGAADLSVARRGINSLSQDLGGKLSWAVPTGFGTVKPEVRAAWAHDYTKSPIASSGIMGGQTFAVTTPRTVADGVRFGAAVSLNSNDALSFRAEYEGELRHQYQGHTGVVKVIWGF